VSFFEENHSFYKAFFDKEVYSFGRKKHSKWQACLVWWAVWSNEIKS